MFEHYLCNCNFQKMPLGSQTGYLHMDDILIRNCLVANWKKWHSDLAGTINLLFSISICFYLQKNATYHSLIFSTLDSVNHCLTGIEEETQRKVFLLKMIMKL